MEVDQLLLLAQQRGTQNKDERRALDNMTVNGLELYQNLQSYPFKYATRRLSQ